MAATPKTDRMALASLRALLEAPACRLLDSVTVAHWLSLSRSGLVLGWPSGVDLPYLRKTALSLATNRTTLLLSDAETALVPCAGKCTIKRLTVVP